MQILSLQLENAKSYVSQTITFTPGANAIVGQNGAGKSTILEAIGFALFDYLPYNQNDFVNEEARFATVTVAFVSSHDERVYQAVRRCGSSSHHYIYDPELSAKVCEGKADVLYFLKLHLGVESSADLGRIFRDAVGVPQGVLTAAFLETPAQRKSTFDPLLQVEEYTNAFNRLLEPRRLLRERQQAVSLRMEGLTARLERLPVLQSEAQSLTTAIQTAAAELTTVQTELAQAQDERQTQEQARSQLTIARSHQERAAQEHISLTRQVTDVRQRQNQAAQAQEIVTTSQSGHDAYEQAQIRKSQLDGQLQQRQKLLAAQGVAEKQLSSLTARQPAIVKALAEVDAADMRILALTPQCKAQEDLELGVTAARQQMADRLRIQESLQQLTTQLARQAARLADLRAEFAQGVSLHTRREIAQTQLEETRQELEGLRTSLVRVQTEQEGAEQQQAALAEADGALCPVCEQPLTPQHRQELVQRTQQRLLELAQDRTHLNTAQKVCQATLHTLQGQLSQLDKELAQLPRQSEIDSGVDQVDELAGAVAEAQTGLQALDGAPEILANLEKELTDLGNPRQEMEFAARTARRRIQLVVEQESLQSQIQSAQTRVNDVTTQLATFADLDEQLEVVAQALRTHLSAYQALLANRQLAAGLEQLQEEAIRLDRALALAKAGEVEAQIALSAAENSFDAMAFEKAQSAERQLSSRQGSLSTQLKLQRRELARIDAELAELAQRSQELAQAETEQERLTAQTDLLEAMRAVLRQAGPYITKALVQQISHEAAQFFGEIMQDYIRRLRWSEDYGILLEVNGRERQFSQLSGGEQMAAALSVRLALLREMSSINVAFFDEPTTNLDESRRESLARQILAVRGFRQLFVISHDDTFEQATENLIRVEKVDQQSMIVS